MARSGIQSKKTQGRRFTASPFFFTGNSATDYLLAALSFFRA